MIGSQVTLVRGLRPLRQNTVILIYPSSEQGVELVAIMPGMIGQYLVGLGPRWRSEISTCRPCEASSIGWSTGTSLPSTRPRRCRASRKRWLRARRRKSRSSRFGERRNDTPGITQHMLTATLKELEAEGLVTRQAFAEIPPRVEYSLCEHARRLEPSLLSPGLAASSTCDIWNGIQVTTSHNALYDLRTGAWQAVI